MNNRDIEMEISLKEMVLSVRKHWKTVLLTALVCLIIGGVFGLLRP